MERLDEDPAESGEPKTRVKSTGKTLVETPVKILAVLKDHPEYSLAEVAAAIGKSFSAVEQAAAKLVNRTNCATSAPPKAVTGRFSNEHHEAAIHKKQAYQSEAVEAVADCFTGQPKSVGIQYRVDPGRAPKGQQQAFAQFDEVSGFKNTDLANPTSQLLENIQAVQRRLNLPLSTALASTMVRPINLDIEMETGIGKTYCYIKTPARVLLTKE